MRKRSVLVACCFLFGFVRFILFFSWAGFFVFFFLFVLPLCAFRVGGPWKNAVVNSSCMSRHDYLCLWRQFNGEYIAALLFENRIYYNVLTRVSVRVFRLWIRIRLRIVHMRTTFLSRVSALFFFTLVRRRRRQVTFARMPAAHGRAGLVLRAKKGAVCDSYRSGMYLFWAEHGCKEIMAVLICILRDCFSYIKGDDGNHFLHLPLGMSGRTGDKWQHWFFVPTRLDCRYFKD